ncbi:MAG: NYN domain-containing protein [bacterium]|nr:NYN domain-containing protein [bacterium]
MIKKIERVCIYVDGSNWYNLLKRAKFSIPKDQKVDLNKLADFLSSGRECVSKRYYVGIIRNVDGTAKSAELVKGQQQFLQKITDAGFVVKRGRIAYDKGVLREKGTDVKIAVDIVIGAVDDYYDTVILVSSDTDLIPALQFARYKNKKIEYVGFANAPCFGLQKYADISILLRQKDVDQILA